MNRTSQRGVALVITLIMLSIVTFMAVAFLALSRRERASVTVTTEQQTAVAMSEAAFARARADLVSRVMARSNAFLYDFTASTNFFAARGFQPNLYNSNNVNFLYRTDGLSLTEADRLVNLANLQFDPRPPVYVRTNNDVRFPVDFRFYLDLNRNGLFETNGLLPELDANGRPIPDLMSYFVGDPEWVGVLQRPGLPHSSSNLFLGRYAFLVLPAGKSLDLNYAHNQAKRPANANQDGYYRNQNVGSWELNLAAFLRDLNTNQWSYVYNTNLNAVSLGTAFSDATDLLRFRYLNNYRLLNSVASLFGPGGSNAFIRDWVDAYTDGPRVNPSGMTLTENDQVDLPWPGSDNPRLYYELQELYNTNKTSIGFTNRLQGTFNPVARRSTYDRYTFYRLLSQMGVDSVPDWGRRLHLNYISEPGVSPTNFVPWSSGAHFFTNAADRLLRRQFSLSLTNIPLYPTNLYSAAIHQSLQVAANIYDATTNRALTAYPHLPSAYRPVFRYDGTNVAITGYLEVTNSAFVNNRWLDLQIAADRNALANDTLRSNVNVYGVPIVIGAKKGFPNFNEFSLDTAVQVSRKLEVRKPAPQSRPNQTNQMFLLGVSNLFGIEAWNSYTQAFPRPLHLRITNQFIMVLTNEENVRFAWTNRVGLTTNFAAHTWAGGEYRLPMATNLLFLKDSAFQRSPPRFTTNYVFETSRGYFAPQWGLTITNRLQYMAIDVASQRVIDFVNLSDLVTHIDISQALIGNEEIGEDSRAAAFWQTNRLGNDFRVPTQGILNQINESLGQGGSANNALWINYNLTPMSGASKDAAIEKFRVFVGLAPLNPQRYPLQQLRMELGNSTSHQAPFTPTRKLYQSTSWQVNDPLVHYTWEDLYDMERTNNIQFAVPPTSAPTNSNLGKLNRRYRPWGGNEATSNDTNAFNLALKDPAVERSDDWDFPTNKFANLGLLGRVHRGTPWQTIYLKSSVAETNAWMLWAVNPFTHPTNDWHILELFTAAPNANAAQGLLSVNQTNIAAWSAVLSGVTALSNSVSGGGSGSGSARDYKEILIQPNSDPLWQIVGSINQTRDTMPYRTFRHLGHVLATPALSVASPFINPADRRIPDAVYERIPQQILSLLKPDDPLVVVYAYGQALKPADRSLVVAPGQPYHLLCTNYQITAEVAAKYVMRLDVLPTPTNVSRLFVTPQRFQFVPIE